MLDSIFEIIYLAGLIVGGMVRTFHTRRYKNRRITLEERMKTDSILTMIAGLGFYLPLAYIFTLWLDFANYTLPTFLGCVGK